MTREDFPDRKEIESALERVQSGELSPAEATQLLLAEVSPLAESAQPRAGEAEIASAESLASLIERLGIPPADVVDAWCRQITRAAITHEQTSGQSLPAIDLNEWAIDTTGELIWKGQYVAQGRGSEKSSAALKTESQGQIDRFRRSLLADEKVPSEDQSTNGSQATTVPIATAVETVETKMRTAAAAPLESQVGPSVADSKSRPERPRNRLRQRFIGGVALVCLVAIVAILIRSSGTNNEIASEPASDVTLAPGRSADVDPAGSGQPSTDSLKSTDRPDQAVGELETFESMGDVDSAATNQADAMLSLEELIPASGFLTPSKSAEQSLTESDTASVSDDPPVSNQVIGDGDTADDVNAAMNSSDNEAPDESPQTTRASTVTAAQLPTVGDVTAVDLWNRSVESLTLAFPTELPFGLGDGDSADGWNILDKRGDVIVARLTTNEGVTRLTWSEDAAKSTLASSLVQGRLTDETGSVIYLRPMIEADPWQIQLDQADVRPTWDLRSPIPPRVARMSIEFDLPEEIEEGWIEPIEPDALRRTRGLAVLTPKDSETVALGMRFDVRCARKLSVRVRYAARLAPTMPWQSVSNASLLQFADQLTEQASVVSRQSTQMAALYERADTNQRRNLRPKRDQLDSLGEALRVASQRVAELQAMIDTIQADGLLRLKVWVTWPDSEQILLTTAPVADDASGKGVRHQ